MSQRPLLGLLQPGEIRSFPLSQADFIYLKVAAKALDVTIESQTIRMEVGEKRRFDRPIDRIVIQNQNTSAVKFEFIHGTGDYEKIIVAGELNVSSYINTGTGEAKSLPTEIEYTVGLEDAAKENVSRSDELANPAVFAASSDGDAGFYFDRHFYAINKTKLEKYTMAGVFVESRALPVALASNYIRGAAFNPDTMTIYVSELKKIWALDFGTLEAQELVDYGPANAMNYGLVYRDGKLWSPIRDDTPSNEDGFRVLDLGSMQTEKLLFDASQVSDKLAYLPSQDRLIFQVGGGHTVKVFNPVSRQFEADQSMATSGIAASAYSPDELLQWSGEGNNGKYSLRYTRDIQYYGTLYFQKGTDVATKQTFKLTNPYPIFKRGAGHVIRGKVIKAIFGYLRLFESVPADYLDKVISLTYYNGYVDITRSAGTASWAYREMEDSLELYLESVVKIELLPEAVAQ